MEWHSFRLRLTQTKFSIFCIIGPSEVDALSSREIVATNNSIIFLYFFSITYFSLKEVVLGWQCFMIKFHSCWWGSLLPGLRMPYPPLRPPLMWAKNFWCMGQKLYPKIQNFMTSPYSIFCQKMPYFGAMGVLDWNPYIFVTWEPIKEFGTLWWALLVYIGILISLWMRSQCNILLP